MSKINLDKYFVEFDEKFKDLQEINAEWYLSNLNVNAFCSKAKAKDSKNNFSEEYIRARFTYALIHSGLYDKEYICIEFGRDWLVLNGTKLDFKIKEIQKIEEVYKRFNNQNLTHNMILENLTFGFWVGLFHSYYNRQIWGKKDCNMMSRIFPHLTEKQRSFKKISKDIDTIRKFRNKIFHFADILSENLDEMEALLTKYTKGVYNGKEFIIW